MSRIILVLSFLFVTTASLSQESIIKFKKGAKYKLYFVDAAMGILSEADTIKTDPRITWKTSLNFFIDDDNSIDELRKRWIGESTLETMYCWYDYFVYVIEDNVCVETLLINEKCKQVVTKNNRYYYSGSMLEDIRKDKLIAVVDVEFGSIENARNFVTDAGNITGSFLPEIDTRQWHKYKGSLSIQTQNGESPDAITRTIRKHAPKDSFFVHQTSGDSPDGIREYNIYCNADFRLKVGEFTILKQWAPIEPKSIRLTGENVFAIRELVKKYEK